jgi:hypothetical protein
LWINPKMYKPREKKKSLHRTYTCLTDNTLAHVTHSSRNAMLIHQVASLSGYGWRCKALVCIISKASPPSSEVIHTQSRGASVAALEHKGFSHCFGTPKPVISLSPIHHHHHHPNIHQVSTFIFCMSAQAFL